MKKVIAICGMICSGKSCYAASLLESENAVLLSTDELTWELTGNEQGAGYDAFAKKANHYLMKKAAQIAERNCTVILDWGFWKKQDRRELNEFFSTRGIPVAWHYVKVSEQVWNKHIRERNERVLSGNGGCCFFVDEGLRQKLLSLWEEPEELPEITVYIPE